TKLHVRLQIPPRFLEKLIGREKPGDQSGNDQSDGEITTCCRDGDAFERRPGYPFLRRPMAREQERQQWKCWESVMRQLGLYQREDDEDDRDARNKIIVDLVPASPRFPRQPGKFDRPRKKADKDRYEIKRQQKEIHPEGVRAVTFHSGKRTADDVSTDPHDEELTVRLHERRNSPECDDRQHKQSAAHEFESLCELRIGQKQFRCNDCHQRDPSDWPFCEKRESKRKIKHPPPGRCLMSASRTDSSCGEFDV